MSPIDPAASYTPAPEANNPNQNIPSDAAQNLSAGFLEASFGILGQTFAQRAGNPALAEPYTKLGGVISNTLHDRWNKQEFENFQAQYVSNYRKAAISIQANLQQQMSALDRGELLQPDGTITKIDVKSEGFLRTKDTLIRQSMQSIHSINDQFFQDAAKYGDNPMISGLAQNLAQSTSNMVGEATGPTPAAASEKGIVEDKLNRAHAGYYDRMPPDAGSKGDERGDPEAMLALHGPDGMLSFLIGTPKGRSWTMPYQKTAENEIAQELIDKNPDIENDDVAMKRELGKNEKIIQQRAAGLFMQTVFPQLGDRMSKIKTYDPYFPKTPEKEVQYPVEGLATKEETDIHIKNAAAPALGELDRVIRTRNPSNINKAIEYVMNTWYPKYVKTLTGDNQNTSEFKRDFRAGIMAWLRDPDNWQKSKIAREKFGTPERGLFERASSAVKNAAETAAETYGGDVPQSRGILK